MPRSTGKQELVYIEPSSVRALQDFSRKLQGRADGKVLKKKLNAEIKKATEPLEREMKSNARGLAFKGSASGQRARRTTVYNKSGSVKKGTGKSLREAMADGIVTEVSYRQGAGAGVRIRLKSKDSDVNRIGKAINRRGKVRHPTRTQGGKGSKPLSKQGSKWADTTATNGKDWFYGPVPKHRDNVTAGVKRAVDAALKDLARDIG